MYVSSQLKWHERVWFVVSVLLNVLSLSALIDEFLGWRSWFSVILMFYRVLTGAVLIKIGLVPPATPQLLVTLITQLLVFMGGVFAAGNFYALRTEGQSVFARVHDTSCRSARFAWLCAACKTAAIYVSGPALLLFLLWKAMVKRAPMQRVLGFTFRPAHVVAYYVSVVGAVAVTLVLAGYLYPHFERQARQGMGVALWQESRLRS
jgi:hypothetical protein